METGYVEGLIVRCLQGRANPFEEWVLHACCEEFPSHSARCREIEALWRATARSAVYPASSPPSLEVILNSPSQKSREGVKVPRWREASPMGALWAETGMTGAEGMYGGGLFAKVRLQAMGCRVGSGGGSVMSVSADCGGERKM